MEYYGDECPRCDAPVTAMYDVSEEVAKLGKKLDKIIKLLER